MQALINEVPTEEKHFFSSKLGNLGIGKKRRVLESFHKEVRLRYSSVLFLLAKPLLETANIQVLL